MQITAMQITAVAEHRELRVCTKSVCTKIKIWQHQLHRIATPMLLSCSAWQKARNTEDFKDKMRS